MKRSSLLISSALAIALIIPAASSWAASGGKGSVDRMLKNAIEETAATQAAPEPLPVTAEKTEPVPPVAPVAAMAPDPVTTDEPTAKTLGYKSGRLLWLPSLSLSQNYDDNIQAAASNTEDDFYTSISPALQVELTDSQHAMILKAAYEANRYWDKSDEDNDNIHTSLAGHIDAGDNWELPYEFHYDLDHEKRKDDLTRQLPKERIEERSFGAAAGIAFKKEKFGFSLMGRYEAEEFENDRDLSGTDVIRSDADRFDYTGEMRLSFNVMDGHNFYFGGSASAREYDRRNYDGTGFNGVKRNSDGFAGFLGWQADFKGKIFSDVKIGYQERDYDEESLSDISDIFASADINWHVTDKTNWSLKGDYGHFEDDEVIDPILRTLIGTMIEQGISESFLVGLGAEYEMLDFEGIDREDETWILSVLADYLINQHLSVGAEYNFETRESDLSALEYDRNLFMLRLTGRL